MGRRHRGSGFTAGIRTAALDPSAVRRRVRQDTLGHRGRKGDPLYGTRRTLQVGAEHRTDKQAARLDARPSAGDPDHEVTLAWPCYRKLRNIYHARPQKGRELVTGVIPPFVLPEVARPGRSRCLPAAGGHRPYRIKHPNHA